jgi:hypothetical protein
VRVYGNVEGRQFIIFGDMGYPQNDVLFAPFKKVVLSADEQWFNDNMKVVREPVEWSFGKICSLWAFLDYKKGVKVGQGNAGKYFQVATFLTNCHSCLYGNETSQFFKTEAPELEDYLFFVPH